MVTGNGHRQSRDPGAQHHRLPVWLALAFALISAAALVVEIVAGRILAPYVGMSLYTWTAIIAVVLAGLSLGHWLGGVLDPGDAPRSHRLLGLSMALAALSTAVVPFVLRLAAGRLLEAGLSPLLAITTLVAVCFALPSLFAGVSGPVLTRLALDAASEGQRSRVLGRMFAAGALGSIGGTLAAGFVLISWLGSTGTLWSVAVLELLLAGVFLVAARAARRTLLAAGVTGAVLAMAILVGGQGFRSACTVESSYFCIRVIDFSAEAGRPSRLMVIDHMGHGISDREEPAWLHSSYIALSDRLVRLHQPIGAAFSAFFVGGGAYTLPRAWLAEFENARLTVAELDPLVTQLAHERFWLPDSPRLAVHHGDARVLLAAQRDARYDVVLGDAFHDISVPSHLTTREFAELVRARLSPRGLYLMHVLDDVARPRFVLAAAGTLMSVFPTVEAWVDRSQWRAGGRISYLLLAGSSPSPTGTLEGSAPDDRAANRAWIRLPPEALRRAVADADVQLLTDDLAPVDRLMYHVLVQDL